MTIRLTSVNVGKLQAIPGRKSQGLTGIYKEPVAGPVTLETGGLAGDHIGSKKYHGGPDQAVYIYSALDYAWWQQTLARDLPPGTFGENLTVSDLGGHPPRVGDLWQIGEAVLELSAPRIPCSTLAARMGEPTFVKSFARANRGGAYARVLKPGALQAGMPITVVASSADNPTIDELFAIWHKRVKDPDLLRRALAAPLASRPRQDVEKWLARLSTEPGPRNPGR
jgi:MOSC domain-containing protein YiiM